MGRNSPDQLDNDKCLRQEEAKWQKVWRAEEQSKEEEKEKNN